MTAACLRTWALLSAFSALVMPIMSYPANADSHWGLSPREPGTHYFLNWGKPMPARIEYKAEAISSDPDREERWAATSTIDFRLQPRSNRQLVSGTATYTYNRGLIPRVCQDVSITEELDLELNVAYQGPGENSLIYLRLEPVDFPDVEVECRGEDGTWIDEVGANPLVLQFVDGRYAPTNNFTQTIPLLPYLTSETTISFACPLHDPAANVHVNITPSADAPWPVNLDHSKSADEIRALKKEDPDEAPSSLLSGLTQYINPRKHSVDWVGQPADFGGGVCFWADTINVELGEIYIYIDRAYATTSCEYKATLEHEMKHYQDFVDALGAYQEYLREALQLMELPTSGWSAFVDGATNEDFNTGTTQADIAVTLRISGIHELIVQHLRLLSKMREAETPDVLAKCSDW